MLRIFLIQSKELSALTACFQFVLYVKKSVMIKDTGSRLKIILKIIQVRISVILYAEIARISFILIWILKRMMTINRGILLSISQLCKAHGASRLSQCLYEKMFPIWFRRNSKVSCLSDPHIFCPLVWRFCFSKVFEFLP